MAWFNESSEKSDTTQDELQPITFERLRALMTRQGWNVGVPDDIENPRFVYGYFDGVYTVFSNEIDDCILVSSFGVGPLELPLNRFEEAVMWAAQHNLATNFGTVFFAPDEDKGVVRLKVDTPVLCSIGVTDEQLDTWVNVALSANIATVQRYAEAFELSTENFESTSEE